MKISQTVLTMIAALGSSVLSAADLNIPMAFEYLALDGQKVKRSMFMHKSELELTPGYHEIAIRYNDMVETDVSDTQEKVKSSAFIITLNAADSVDYFLQVAGDGEVVDPLKFAEAPDVVIVRKGGGTVDYKLTHTDITEKSFATQLYGQSPQKKNSTMVKTDIPNTAEAAAEYSSSPVPISAPVAASTTVAGAGAAEAGETTATPEQMLHLWWQRADENTRKEFLSWAIKQL